MLFYKIIILFILLFSISFNSYFAFQINKNFISLKNIVNSNAVLSTVISQVNNEVINENLIMNEINNNKHNYNLDLLYSLAFIYSLYLQYKYFSYIDNKWKDIKAYSIIKNKLNIFLLIMISVFTRNVQNAI